MQLRSIIVACFAGAFLVTFGQRVSSSSAKQRKPSAAPHKAPKAPPVFELHKVSETDFSEPPPVFRMGQSRCDNDGDIYIAYSTMPLPQPRPGRRIAIRLPDPTKIPVSKISPDSQTVTEFPTPSLSGYQSLAATSFSVDPSGAVYSLSLRRSSPASEEGAEPWKNVVIKFNSDASVDSTILLQNPSTGLLGVEQIAAFANGNLLVDGAAHDTARRRITPFTAVYDSNGEIMQVLKLPGYAFPSPRRFGRGPLRGRAGSAKSRAGATKKSSKQQKQKVAPGLSEKVLRSLLVSGQEDTAYLLRTSVPAILYTISSDGQVLHHAQVQYPDHAAAPDDITRAGQSDVAIVYYVSGVDKAGKVYARNNIAIVDPSTGKIVAIYRPPAKLRVSFACATSPTDFLFVGSTKSWHLAVARYSGS